jgi:hypothetical protein
MGLLVLRAVSWALIRSSNQQISIAMVVSLLRHRVPQINLQVLPRFVKKHNHHRAESKAIPVNRLNWNKPPGKMAGFDTNMAGADCTGLGSCLSYLAKYFTGRLPDANQMSG